MTAREIHTIFEADSNVKEVSNLVRSEVERSIGRRLSTWEALKYVCIPENPMIYLVKVHVGDRECVHIKIHKATPRYPKQLEILSIQRGVNINTPLE